MVVPRDSATAALYDSVGKYDVLPLGPGPTARPVVALDMNDSGVVVGYFGEPLKYAGDPGPEATSSPFRWRDGVFELLQTGEAQAGMVRAVNGRGDVVGNAGFAAVWFAGSTVPVPLFPEGSTDRDSKPMDINMNRDVLARDVVLHSLVVNVTTGEVRIRAGYVEPAAIGPGGEALGRFTSTLYPPAVLLRPGSQSFDCSWGGHGSARAFDLNDSSIALVHQTNNVGGAYHGSFVYDTRIGCNAAIGLDPGPPTDTGVTLRSLSNANWLVGSVHGVESVMILNKKGFAVLDSVLMASGPESSGWRVRQAIRVNAAGTFLVIAARPSGGDLPALLVRRHR